MYITYGICACTLCGAGGVFTITSTDVTYATVSRSTHSTHTTRYSLILPRVGLGGTTKYTHHTGPAPARDVDAHTRDATDAHRPIQRSQIDWPKVGDHRSPTRDASVEITSPLSLHLLFCALTRAPPRASAASPSLLWGEGPISLWVWRPSHSVGLFLASLARRPPPYDHPSRDKHATGHAPARLTPLTPHGVTGAGNLPATQAVTQGLT